MKNLVVGFVALAAVAALTVLYVTGQDTTDAPDSANLDTAAIYEYCTSYGGSVAHCACSVEQAKSVFLAHDWDTIRILHRDGLPAMQAYLVETYDTEELNKFVSRMSELDGLNAQNCPPV